jgi:hypothetical protein
MPPGQRGFCRAAAARDTWQTVLLRTENCLGHSTTQRFRTPAGTFQGWREAICCGSVALVNGMLNGCPNTYAN